MSNIIGIDISRIDEVIRRKFVAKKYHDDILIALCVIFRGINISSNKNKKVDMDFIKRQLPLNLELYLLLKKPEAELAKKIKQAFSEIIAKFF